MAARRDPVDRILDGLVAAIDRHGSQKVSVADVSEAAGVSRGTIYRYFPSREDLFAALGAHTLGWLSQVVDRAVAADPVPEHRVAVVVGAISRSAGDGTHFRQAYHSEPGYVLDHFQGNWDDIIALLRDALVPAFARPGDEDEVAERRAEIAADLIARQLLSHQLIRSHHTTDADLVAVVEAYAASGA